MAESASAQLTLLSTSGTAGNPVYNYDVTVTNTGTTSLGTFWMGWMPGQDFLPSTPGAVSSPSGWTSTLTGSGNNLDGTAIEWVASSNPIAPGQSLGGFDFSTKDSPQSLAANSPSHPASPALTSFVYGGAPFSDAGFTFVVSPAPVTPPTNTTPTNTSLASSAPSANSGDSVKLTATVTPSTSGAAPTGTVSFALGGTALGSAPLQTDGTATLTTTTLPAGSDSIVATYSGDGAYAGSSSNPFVESIVGAPSLNASITKSTLPDALVSGTAAKGAVTLSVVNQSGATVKGKATTAVYASMTGGIDGSSILLGQVTKTLNVPAGKAATAVVPLHIGATTLPAGTYTLFARVIDPSGNAVDSAPGASLSVAAAFVALTESVASSSLPTSAAANSKAHGTVVLNVTNGGNVTTSATTAAVLYATTNGVVDGSAVQLAAMALPLKIKPGKPVRATLPLKLIPALAPGTYTVVAQLTDQNHEVSSVMVGSLTVTG